MKKLAPTERSPVADPKPNLQQPGAEKGIEPRWGQTWRPFKPLLGFLGRFVLVIALLLAPWPGWKDGYAGFVRWLGQTAFPQFGSNGIVVFRPNSGADRSQLDTIIYVGNRDMLKPGGKLPAANVKYHSRLIAYLPMTVMIALVLATPIPWRRRLWALLWSVVLMHLFILLCVAIMILHQYSDSPGVGLYQLQGFPKQLVDSLYDIFITYLGARFTVPVLIWILVCFRREDLGRILPASHSAGGPDAMR